MSTTPSPQTDLTQNEREEIDRANESGRTPVVFVHGLWLLPSSWDRWGEVADKALEFVQRFV